MYKYTKLIYRNFTSFSLTFILNSDSACICQVPDAAIIKTPVATLMQVFLGLMFYDSVIEKKHLDSWPTVNLTRARHASAVSHTFEIAADWVTAVGGGTARARRAFKVNENDSTSQRPDANSLTGYIVTHKGSCCCHTSSLFKHVKPPLDCINLKKKNRKNCSCDDKWDSKFI